MSVSREPSHTHNAAGLMAPAPAPAYVQAALKGLTPTQKKFVLAGCVHGDFTMATVRALQSKALFYLHIDSPNGRWGTLRLTPLGVTVQGILKGDDDGDHKSSATERSDLTRDEQP